MTTQKFITHFLSMIVGVVIGGGGLILYLNTSESPPSPPPTPPKTVPYVVSTFRNYIQNQLTISLKFNIDESFVINEVTVNEGNCSVMYDGNMQKVTFPKSVVMGTYLTLHTDCERILKVIVDSSNGKYKTTFR